MRTRAQHFPTSGRVALVCEWSGAGLGKLGKIIQLAGAVAESVHRRSSPVEDGEIKVGHGRVLRIFHVPACLNCAAAFASEDDWQFVMIVTIAITDAAAVNDHAIIQQTAFAFADGL